MGFPAPRLVQHNSHSLKICWGRGLPPESLSFLPPAPPPAPTAPGLATEGGAVPPGLWLGGGRKKACGARRLLLQLLL